MRPCGERAVAALAAVLSIAPAAGQPAGIPAHPRELRFPEMPTALGLDRAEELDLAGATVILVPERTLPLVEIAVATPAGSRLDPLGGEGLAALTAALLRRGGAGDLAAADLDERADELGADLDAAAGETRAGLSLSVLSASLEPALDLLFAMLQRPRFQADRLDRVRDGLLDGLERQRHDPAAVVVRAWEHLLVDPPAARLPTAASLGTLTAADLAAFHRRHFSPESLVVAVSGDFDATTMRRALEQRLSAWPADPGDEAKGLQATAPPDAGGVRAQSTPAGLYHVELDTPHVEIVLGHSVADLPWLAPERGAVAVLGEILGGASAVSRLAGSLRTAEGLTYRVSGRLQPGAAAGPGDSAMSGELHIALATAPVSAARAVATCREVLESLRARSPSESDVAVARASLLARLLLDFDTAEEVAGWLAEDRLLGRPHGYWESYRDAIAAAAPAAVRTAARENLDLDRLVVLTVGRWGEISGGAAAGASELERLLARSMVHLDPFETPSAPGSRRVGDQPSHNRSKASASRLLTRPAVLIDLRVEERNRSDLAEAADVSLCPCAVPHPLLRRTLSPTWASFSLRPRIAGAGSRHRESPRAQSPARGRSAP